MSSSLAPASFMIRVVSLATAFERRSHFSASAAGTSLPWAFSDAHTACCEPLLNDAPAQLARIGRPLGSAEIGCYSSHVSIWREFLDSDAKVLVVFEDDVVVDWRFVEHLLSFDLCKAGVMHLRLFNKVPCKYVLLASPFMGRYHHLIRNKKFALGTQAYVLTREGAGVLQRHCRVIVRPIDVEIDRAWAHGVPSLTIVPSPVFERFVGSTIGLERFEARRASVRFHVYRLSEVLRRVLYNVRFALSPPDFVRKARGAPVH